MCQISFRFISYFSDVFVCGIEAHACIQCTVGELIERGITAHVIVDAVSASHQVNRFAAFRQMEKWGANLITSEQMMMQTMGIVFFKFETKT